MSVLSELFQSIADAIRTKTGGTAAMKPAEFPDQINSIVVGSSATGGDDGMITELLWTNPNINVMTESEFTFDKDYEWFILEYRSNTGSKIMWLRTDPMKAPVLVEEMPNYAGSGDCTFYRYQRVMTVSPNSISLANYGLKYGFGTTPTFENIDDLTKHCVIYRIWGVYNAA